jgi:6-pyruvoyltetrahydropterin/6-carboxytetrahydropterin synthase
MLVDFGHLKTILTTEIHDVLDHGFIVYEGDQDLLELFVGGGTTQYFKYNWKVIIFPYIPTAENLARWCWEQLKFPLDQHFRGNLLLDCIKVWETPTSTATYVGSDRGY